jgi:putative ABC transport system ATP-binding protein
MSTPEVEGHEAGGPVLLRARHVGVRIGSRDVLVGIDLEVRTGRLLVVTGPAGAGKTTLLHVLAGIIRPTEGEVLWNDGRSSLRWGEGNELGFVPQIFGLAAALTTEENVALPLQLLRLNREEVARRVERTLTALGLENAAQQLATELSGGQQQRAAVGRAIVAEPRLIIADEPTSELDAANRDLVFGLLKAATDRGATVVLATHDRDLVERSDDVFYLHDGRSAGTGP